MSFIDELFNEGGGGAPNSPSRAGDINQTVDEGKIEFEKSAPLRHEKNIENQKSNLAVLPPVVETMSQEEYEKRKQKGVNSNNGRLSDVEWRPTWKPRKRPHGKGWEKNADAIEAIESELDKSRVPIAPLNLPPAGVPDEVVEEILSYVASGGSLSRYCEKTGLRYNRFWRLVSQNPELKRRYQQARLQSVDAIADEALRIATEPAFQEDVMETYDETGQMRQKAVKRYDNVYARKLAFQSRQWLLSKLAPDKYGEKPQTGDTDSRAARILAARKRLAAELKAAEEC